MSKITGRIKAIERTMTRVANHADTTRALERIKQMQVTRVDLENIARGEWQTVHDAELRATKYRERWERAATVCLTALDLDAHAVSRDA
jgi:hypothetical protein